MLGETLLYGLCVAAFNRPRPTLYPHLSRKVTASFPRRHVLAPVIFWGALYVLARRRSPRAARWVGGAGLLAAPLIGLSRLYLQVHHPLGVLASLLLGGAWVLLLEGVFGAAALFSPAKVVGGAVWGMVASSAPYSEPTNGIPKPTRTLGLSRPEPIASPCRQM